MSKKKVKKANNKSNTKRKNDTKNTIIAACLLIAVIIIISVCYVIYSFMNPPSGLEDTQWRSVSAYDASKDEVDINSVYNNYYSSYLGSMSFKSDGTFTFWMGAGDPEDGSHKGEYKYNKDDTVKASFDNGDEIVLKIIRNDDNSIQRLEVPYEGYTIYFE